MGYGVIFLHVFPRILIIFFLKLDQILWYQDSYLSLCLSVVYWLISSVESKKILILAVMRMSGCWQSAECKLMHLLVYENALVGCLWSFKP